MASTILKPQEDFKASRVISSGDSAGKSPVHVILKPRVLVVIPCYNEEVSIGSVVLRALTYTDQVVVVDDGSADRTAEVARLAGAEVVRHGVNRGKGAGVRTAFEYARKHDADVLVLIDGDGQHDPEEIPQLIAPILNGEADMVNGSRFLVKHRHHVPAYRRIGQDVLTLATNAGSGHRLTDSQNGFRAFARKTFGCFTFGENGMGIESEMLMDAAKARLRIKEVPIDVRYDVAGSTFNPIVHGFSVLGSVFKAIVRRRQTLAFALPGSLLLVGGIAAFYVLLSGFGGLTASAAVGYATASLLCIILGILCIFTLLVLKTTGGTRDRAKQSSLER